MLIFLVEVTILDLLKKIIDSSFDKLGFPKSRNIRQLNFFETVIILLILLTLQQNLLIFDLLFLNGNMTCLKLFIFIPVMNFQNKKVCDARREKPQELTFFLSYRYDKTLVPK